MIIIIINYYDYQVMFLRQKNFSEAVETLKSFEKQDNKVVEKKRKTKQGGRKKQRWSKQLHDTRISNGIGGCAHLMLDQIFYFQKKSIIFFKGCQHCCYKP